MQLGDVVENESRMQHMKPSGGGGGGGGGGASSMDEPRGNSKGFVVREAPWTEKVTFFF